MGVTMDAGLPAVLLIGGEGMGPIEATARALGNALYDENLGEPIGQVLVICGRNKKLASKLLSVEWKILVQAGPGTIADAMIRSVPIILNGYIAGQSMPVRNNLGNGVFLTFGIAFASAGSWECSICGGEWLEIFQVTKKIANIVAQWFGPKAVELKRMSQSAVKLARPDAVFKIVHDLHELVRHRNFVPLYSCST
ncbi:putative monogalactosyldiacylglycerol synthase 1 [Hibiscus syriacus]|uniref:Monogalactosyldiacylglycerol synthase 1 n=1 Tax=Hibiscus syriacus TaxID=106335 RepID=A0A6A3CUN8_HIBSY|nr:putative monogalactosyldiacylglycerol synthase 1 [Hibiscus syriacus]